MNNKTVPLNKKMCHVLCTDNIINSGQRRLTGGRTVDCDEGKYYMNKVGKWCSERVERKEGRKGGAW
jgi:hypothetical protein